MPSFMAKTTALADLLSSRNTIALPSLHGRHTQFDLCLGIGFG